MLLLKGGVREAVTICGSLSKFGASTISDDKVSAVF